MDRRHSFTRPSPCVLRTMGFPILTGSCELTYAVRRRRAADLTHSIDGKFTCVDEASVTEIFMSGARSVLDDDDGISYIISFLDGSGAFHVVKSFTRVLSAVS
jgi:hypothetical protein